MRRALGVLMLLTACQGGDDGDGVGPDGIGDGARLHARFVQGGGGRQQITEAGVATWSDTALATDCRFQQTSDGFRCLPRYLSYLPGGSYYEDSECTKPLVLSRDECPETGPCYAVRFDADDCGGGWPTGVQEVGEAFSPSVGYWMEADGSCGTRDRPEIAYRLGEVQPLSMFVAGSLQRHDGPGRIDVVNLVGDDGSSAPWYFYDEVLDVPCQAESFDTLGGESSCIPMEGLSAGIYGDDACSQPLASRYNDCPVDPRDTRYAVHSYSDNRCTDTFEVYRVGEPVEPVATYRGVGEMCTAGDPVSYQDYYTTAELIPRDQLVEMPLTPYGDGRLQPLYYAPVDGTPMRASAFFDRDLGVRCDVNVIAGSNLCLPAFAGEHTAFADAACAEPITVGWHARWECYPDAPFPSFAVGGIVDGEPGADWTIYDIVDELPPGSVYELDDGGACVVLPDVRYGSLGAVRPITDFVELTSQ